MASFVLGSSVRSLHVLQVLAFAGPSAELASPLPEVPKSQALYRQQIPAC